MTSRRWLALCGLILLVHLGLLLAGSWQRSYDAWTHLFLASHWQQSWWNDFEPRWYGGFSVFTYPPLAHQTLALPAFFIGLGPAFVLMQTLMLAALGLGLWRYSRIWFDETTAWLATVLGLSLPSLAMTVHLFGQYPNTLSLALVLNLLPWVARWLDGGPVRELIKAELLLLPAALTSLFTNFLGTVMFALPVLIACWQRSAEPLRSKLSKLALLLGLGIATQAGSLWPLWIYLRQAPLTQTRIPHASRGNVLIAADSYFTFYGLYGPTLLLLLPLLLWLLRRRRWDFLLPALVLLLLSSGGATPLNRLLLGRLFDVLTFDRFAFWNSLLLLPPLAAMLLGLRRLRPPLDAGLSLAIGGLWLCGFLVNGFSPFWKPLPATIDPAPLLQRLNQADMRQVRFLSLGLGGNQLAALTSFSPTATIDGNYNFARRLPALNQAPIALLDEAKYYGDEGIEALSKFLRDPQPYHLRWVLLKDLYYTPLLQASGWTLQTSLGQGLQLWETRLPIAPIPPRPRPDRPQPAQLYWGVMPWLPLLLLGLWLSPAGSRRRGTLPPLPDSGTAP